MDLPHYKIGVIYFHDKQANWHRYGEINTISVVCIPWIRLKPVFQTLKICRKLWVVMWTSLRRWKFHLEVALRSRTGVRGEIRDICMTVNYGDKAWFYHIGLHDAYGSAAFVNDDDIKCRVKCNRHHIALERDTICRVEVFWQKTGQHLTISFMKRTRHY